MTFRDCRRWEKPRAIGSELVRTLGVSKEDVVPLIRIFRSQAACREKGREMIRVVLHTNICVSAFNYGGATEEVWRS